MSARCPACFSIQNDLTVLWLNFVYSKIYADILSVLTGNYTRVYPKVSGLAAWSENCK